MSRRQYSLSKQLVVAAALALGGSSVALADDSSMNMWTGDSYAYFNGGKNFPYGKPVLDEAPSTYRPTPPQDPLSYQRQHFPFAIAVDDAPSTYHANHPQDALTFQPQHFPYANAPVAIRRVSSIQVLPAKDRGGRFELPDYWRGFGPN